MFFWGGGGGVGADREAFFFKFQGLEKTANQPARKPYWTNVVYFKWEGQTGIYLDLYHITQPSSITIIYKHHGYFAIFFTISLGRKAVTVSVDQLCCQGVGWAVRTSLQRIPSKASWKRNSYAGNHTAFTFTPCSQKRVEKAHSIVLT